MNSYADLKAFCASQGGLVCTSSNAHKAFEYAFDEGDKVLFLPDKHLGENTAHRLDMEDEIAEWDPWDPEARTPTRSRKATSSSGTLLPGPRTVPRGAHRGDPGGQPGRQRYRSPRVSSRGRRGGGQSRFDRDDLRNRRERDPGDTWAIGTEIHLTNHLQRWHPDVNVVPLCGDACMDCNAMRQIDPNYLTWVLEELAAGREHNVIEVAPEEKELAGVALDRMLEI